jgi:hypothetical protein
VTRLLATCPFCGLHERPSFCLSSFSAPLVSWPFKSSEKFCGLLAVFKYHCEMIVGIFGVSSADLILLHPFEALVTLLQCGLFRSFFGDVMIRLAASRLGAQTDLDFVKADRREIPTVNTHVAALRIPRQTSVAMSVEM